MSKANHNTKSTKPPVCLGIDLAKRSVYVHGVDESGETCVDRKMTINQLRRYLGNLPPCKVAMESCGRAHHWGREGIRMGHDAKLIAPKFVKPYVMSNKNDRADAAAIRESAQRPNTRFVGVKSEASQSHLALHRARSLAVGERTALGNQIRGLLAEFGIEIAKGKSHIAPMVQQILGDGGTHLVTLHPLFLDTLNDLYQELQHKERRIEEFNRRIQMIATQDERAKLLMTIPGFGPITSTALVAMVGDPGVFRNGRAFAAWLGLVPRQHSTGGKDQLLGISKRGDIYLRTRLVHGARSVLLQRSRNPKSDRQSQWIVELPSRKHGHVTAVALANRMARIAWAILTTNQPCRA